MRVLDWIIKRCEGKLDAVKTPVGNLPKAEDIDLSGLDVDRKTMDELLKVDVNEWLKEADGISGFYASIGPKLPEELETELENLKKSLS
jgi:phosphoenolpyruvate carboxykinase (GTP)